MTAMRLRFTIRDLLWLTVIVGMGFGWWLSHHPKGIVGTWQGLGQLKDFTFQFTPDKMGISNKFGTVWSPYTISQNATQLTIDIDGENGLQKGIYTIRDDNLTMRIADPLLLRPDGFSTARSKTITEYAMKRIR